MITVEKFLTEYCKSRNLPAPSPEDLRSIGNFIGYHFRHFWAPSMYKPGEVVPDSGFIVVKGGFVVNFYPDIFYSEMVARTDIFYSKYVEKVIDELRVETQAEFENEVMNKPEKKRKRIPSKKIPENKKHS